MNIRFFKAGFLAAGLLASVPAYAGAPDWKTLMAGIDGVITYCDSSTGQGYAKDMCEAMASEIAGQLEGSGLTVKHNGLVLTSSKEPSETATQAARTADGMTLPLLIAIVLKGTDDGNPAIYIRVQFSIPFEAAVEQGSSLPPKKGELLVLERAVVGNGPKKRLPAAQIDFITKAITPVISGIKDAAKGG